MSLGLSAPAALEVEVRSDDRRLFRLTRQIGPGGIELAQPAPFEIGRPVRITFRLPDLHDEALPPIELRAEIDLLGAEVEEHGEKGGCLLRFADDSVHALEARDRIRAYVAKRLGLPSPASTSRG